MSNRFGTTVRRLTMALMVAATGLAGSAFATLLDRGADMVYDTVLDITWTRHAGDGVKRNWSDANAWAAGLVFGGKDDWRLPWASVIAGPGPTGAVHACTGAGGADELACRDNEMGYMYYYNLDGDLLDDRTGTRNAPPPGGEELTGIGIAYWSGTEFDSISAWDFVFNSGGQFIFDLQRLELSAWAVRAGDIASAPEPASLFLFGVAALGLGWSRQRGRRR